MTIARPGRGQFALIFTRAQVFHRRPMV